MEDRNSIIRALIDEHFPATGNKEPIYDGIIDLDSYDSCRYKTTWILKEPHDEFDENGEPDGGGWFISDGYADQAKKLYPMHLTLAQISYFISHVIREVTKAQLDEARKSSLMPYFKALGYVNVNKYPARRSSVNSAIEAAYEANKDVIQKQLSIMSPEILIFCVGDHLFDFGVKRDLGLDEILMRYNDSVSYYVDKQNRLIIQADHPSRRQEKAKYVNGILNAVAAWEKLSI